MSSKKVLWNMHKVSSGPLLSDHIFCSIQIPMILLVDSEGSDQTAVHSEGPNQTAWMCRLIWAIPVHVCPDMFLRATAQIVLIFAQFISETNLNISAN